MNHVIVADLGYGDAGKGTVVDWLCSSRGGEPVHTVVRFNGGAQAGHNVVTADGRQHTFAQFGSGTFTPGVRTHLSRFVLVDPLALAAEAGHLASIGVADALDRLTIDRDALLVTPYHRAANQARERARGANRHGSCGMGIGETASYALRHAADAPRVSDCSSARALSRKLGQLRDRLAAELGSPGGSLDGPAGGSAGRSAGRPFEGPAGGSAGRPFEGPFEGPPLEDLCDAYRAFAARVALVDDGYLPRVLHESEVVFEGAQGVLLDEWRGFHPYTTWSTTTFANARALLAEAGETATRLGVVRCYMTRHGPGPFPTEDPSLELPEPHNEDGTWQGAFRTGHLDAVALRYAAEVSDGLDAVAVTHLDTASRAPLRLCRSYRIGGRLMDRIVPGPEGDLAWQERLTGTVLRALPEYVQPGADWAGVIEDVLRVPVVLRSYGPAAADKQALTRALASGRS